MDGAVSATSLAYKDGGQTKDVATELAELRALIASSGGTRTVTEFDTWTAFKTAYDAGNLDLQPEDKILISEVIISQNKKKINTAICAEYIRDGVCAAHGIHTTSYASFLVEGVLISTNAAYYTQGSENKFFPDTISEAAHVTLIQVR